MFDWVSNTPLLSVKNKEKLFYVIEKTNVSRKRPVFRNVKQTLHYKVAMEQI